jgi:hypothetical protein
MLRKLIVCASILILSVASNKKEYRTHMDCDGELYSKNNSISFMLMSDKVTKHHF